MNIFSRITVYRYVLFLLLPLLFLSCSEKTVELSDGIYTI